MKSSVKKMESSSRMLPSSSNRGTPVSSDITKIIRQHYKPPSAKPYRHELIQCRDESSCKQNKPDDYWIVNYQRRQNNFDCGFYTSPCEPYKPIGGEIILDPFELVTSSLPGTIDKRLHPRHARRGTIYQLTDRLMLGGTAAVKEEKEDFSIPPEELIDNCPTAGFANIRKFLKDSNKRIIAIKSGMPYEEQLRLEEEWLQEAELYRISHEDENNMVIQTISDSLLLPFNDLPKINLTPKEDEDSARTSSPFSFDSESESLTQKWRKGFSATPKIRKSPLRSAKRRQSSGLGGLTKERLCRDFLEFLAAIHMILTALHNMKVRDLRSKVPLSKEVVERLQKEIIRESHSDGGDRSGRATYMSRWSQKRQSTDPDHFPDDSGRMSVFCTSKRVSMMDTFGKLRRRSRMLDTQQTRPMFETWEDFVNYQPPELQEPQSLFTQVGILSKFMRWFRRASIAPPHAAGRGSIGAGSGSLLPQIDKAQLRRLEELKEKGLADKDSDKDREPAHPPAPVPTHSAAGNQEKARRLPIWLQVAQEKSTVFQNKKSTSPESPYTVIDRMQRDTYKMKQMLQKENTAALEKHAREKLATFRLKFGALSQKECSPLYSEQVQKLNQVKENAKKSHLENLNFDIQPSKWYEELREKSQSSVYCDDQAIGDMITKLQAYCHMDNKTVSYPKAKLCLLVMSLPAYSICDIQTQKALKFIFEQVLLGNVAQLEEWLNHRKIPYVIQEFQDSEAQPNLNSPTLRSSPTRLSSGNRSSGSSNSRREKHSAGSVRFDT